MKSEAPRGYRAHVPVMWSPTGQSPCLHAEVRYGTQAWLLHMLRKAEPSEAYPTVLVQSFEGYPLRIHRPMP